MQTVGAYEAKTHLPRLLDEVAQGKSITITRHGVPVAMLVPPRGTARKSMNEIIAGFKEARRRVKPLGKLTIRDLIEEGRRY